MDKPRTLYEITEIWNLKGNPLYQKKPDLGMKIVDWMEKNKFVKIHGKPGRKKKIYSLSTTPFKKEPSKRDITHYQKARNFIYENRDIFFNIDLLKLLIKNNIETLKKDPFNMLAIMIYISKYFIEGKYLLDSKVLKTKDEIAVWNYSRWLELGLFKSFDILSYVKEVKKRLKKKGAKIPDLEPINRLNKEEKTKLKVYKDLFIPF